MLRLVLCAVLSLAGACADRLGARLPAPRQTTAFVHVNLIPMTAERVVPDQTVVIKAGRIAEVGPSTQTAIPPGAVVIDGRGAYLMPGLADMHMHTREDWLGNIWPVVPFDLYLANGVTTIRDFGPIGRSQTYALRWRDDIARGKLRGPTLYVAGMISGLREDAAGLVEARAAQGVDFIKMYSFLSRDDYRRAMAAAKRLGIYTTGHIPFAVGLDGAITEGMDEIAHIEELDFELLDFDRNRKLQPRQWFQYVIRSAAEQFGTNPNSTTDEIIHANRDRISAFVQKLQIKDIAICTTLVVSDVLVRKLFEPERFLSRPENMLMPRGYLRAFRRGEEKHQRQFAGNAKVAKLKSELERALLIELKRAGIRLLLATDAGTGAMGIVPGLSIHDELQILTEGGLTPYEAIAAGTSEASKVVAAMTGDDAFGTIEVNKRADLILIAENPLEDVANIKRVQGVMANGRWYPRETLERITAARK